MNIYILGEKMVLPETCHTLIVELDNGNRVRLFEIDSGTIQLENITASDRNKRGEFGLLISPYDVSTVTITPEGG